MKNLHCITAQTASEENIHNVINKEHYCTYAVRHLGDQKIMKQLDVVMSPPAFVWDPYLTSTHVTFDLNPCDL